MSRYISLMCFYVLAATTRIGDVWVRHQDHGVLISPLLKVKDGWVFPSRFTASFPSTILFKLYFSPFPLAFLFLFLSPVFLANPHSAPTESHLLASHNFILNLSITTFIDFLPLPLPSFRPTLFQNWVIGPSTVSSSVLAILCSVFFFRCFIFCLSSLVVLPTLSVWHSECFLVSCTLLPCIFFHPILLPSSSFLSLFYI